MTAQATYDHIFHLMDSGNYPFRKSHEVAQFFAAVAEKIEKKKEKKEGNS